MTILFLLLLGLVCYGQRSNPFDIPGKASNALDAINVTSDTVINESLINVSQQDLDSSRTHADPSSGLSTTNPFDIGKSEGTAISSRVTDSDNIASTSFTPGKDSFNSSVVVLIYSIIMLIILTLAISIDKKRFNRILRSCVNSNTLRSLYRDSKAWSNGQTIILYIFFFFNLAFIIWFLDLKINQSPMLHLLWIIPAIVGCYAVRHMVMWTISTVFPLGPEVGLHNFSISLHNIVLGVVLLPFILALEFMPNVSYLTLLYAIIGACLVLYVLRQIKGLLMGVGMRGFNPFYFFIYLCAIEIAPILVAYKMMIGAL